MRGCRHKHTQRSEQPCVCTKLNESLSPLGANILPCQFTGPHAAGRTLRVPVLPSPHTRRCRSRVRWTLAGPQPTALAQVGDLTPSQAKMATEFAVLFT